MPLQISIKTKKALLPGYLLNIFGSKAVFFLLPCMLKDPFTLRPLIAQGLPLSVYF